MQTHSTMTTMRELDAAEIAEISGGNYIVTIGGSTLIGGVVRGLSYSYDVAISGTAVHWTAFTASTLQGAFTGFLARVGGIAFTMPGGFVAGVTAESTAAVVTITDPASSLQ